MATLRNRTVIDFHKNPSHTSFKGKSLNRADIEWLLATLDGQGPIDWNVKDQRDRKGLNIYGADLSEVNLRRLPLARLNAGTDYWRIKPFEEQKEVVVTVMKKADLSEAQLQGANFNGVYLQEADLRDTELEKASFFGAQLQSAVLSGSQLEEDNLSYAQLQGASLDGATLEKAVLIFAQLREATISEAHLEKADLSFAQLQSVDLSETHLENVDLRQTVFGDQNKVGPKVVDVHWDGVNMAVVEWAQVKLLGDEYEARQRTRPNGIKKDREERFDEYQTAVRANRQLAVVLQSQGINEDAGRFIYRAQVLQRKAFWTQRSFGKWLFSLLLFLAAGYGYRPWRSFLTYFLVIFSFASCTKSALPCVKKRSR